MKLAFKVSYILTMLFLLACSKPSGPIIIHEIGEISLTSFDDLKVGDQFKFSLFIGENYFDAGNQNFEYTDDYLNIEVIEKLPNGFKVREWIDPSSNMFSSSENYYYNDKDVEYINNWIIGSNTITIERGEEGFNYSHLFLDLFRTQQFDLRDFNNEEIEITSWKTDKGFSESDADFYVKDFELLGNIYDHLNVVVRDEPMAADGNGNTYLYSQEAGFVRVLTYSAWTGIGLGWDRVMF